ncbi:MAG TPA: YbaK/EbsC family protein [Anaerolineaceae bacterium]
MRLSRLFNLTLRESPAEINLPGLQYLVRAGYLQPLASGAFAYLPLGWLALENTFRLLEKRLPLEQAQPAAFSEGPLSLAQATQQAAEAIRPRLRSYRQLPLQFYRRGQVVSPDYRASLGLLDSRSGYTLDIFWLQSNPEHLRQDGSHFQSALESTLVDLGLPVVRVEDAPGWLGADSGASYAWLMPFPGGQDTWFACPACGYHATPAVGRFRRESVPIEPLLPMEKVATPHCPTIESLAQLLCVPTSRTAKAVFLVAVTGSLEAPKKQVLVFAVVRGDMPVNADAILRLMNADALRPATDVEIQSIGAVPGYASPVGLLKDSGCQVIVDRLIPQCANLVSGANDAGYHLLNVNYGRDYTAHQVAEIAGVQAGASCPSCGAPLERYEGVRLASWLAGAESFASRWDLAYFGEDTLPHPPALGFARVEVSRLLGILAEQQQDERGLCLPDKVAPFAVHLVMLAGKSGIVEPQAIELVSQLEALGVTVLFDDRSESAGVKFNDADLIGSPLRITISERSLKNQCVEVKSRRAVEPVSVPYAEAASKALAILKQQ